MKTTFYIVLNKRGPVRMTKNSPSLARDEIAVGLKLTVPENVFRNPTVMAEIEIPERAILVPQVHAEVIDAQAIEARSGETERLDLEGESAVREDAPQSPPEAT